MASSRYGNGSEPHTTLLYGQPRALARAITWMENGHPRPGSSCLGLAAPGPAMVVASPAPQGGKIDPHDQLARALRAEGKKVGILAVDPTSPFSGGAILGDRIRMNRIAADRASSSAPWPPGVLGGLARAPRMPSTCWTPPAGTW